MQEDALCIAQILVIGDSSSKPLPHNDLIWIMKEDVNLTGLQSAKRLSVSGVARLCAPEQTLQMVQFLLGYLPSNRLHNLRNKVGRLLGCCAIYSARSLPTFHRCSLPPSLGQWWRQQKHLLARNENNRTERWRITSMLRTLWNVSTPSWYNALPYLVWDYNQSSLFCKRNIIACYCIRFLFVWSRLTLLGQPILRELKTCSTEWHCLRKVLDLHVRTGTSDARTCYPPAPLLPLETDNGAVPYNSNPPLNEGET
jgi:hypothetical protein